MNKPVFNPNILSRASRGFSLIEVMVAVFVLSIGLLGMAALMATSLRNNQSADYRSQAVNLAHDAIDMMRANAPNTRRYARAYTNPRAFCSGAAEAPFAYNATAQLYTQDRNYWGRKLCRVLPQGSGQIAITGTLAAGYTAQVDVCWLDSRAATDAATAVCPALAAGESGACSDGDNGAVCVIRITSGI